jgi:hypothetical protein
MSGIQVLDNFLKWFHSQTQQLSTIQKASTPTKVACDFFDLAEIHSQIA